MRATTSKEQSMTLAKGHLTKHFEDGLLYNTMQTIAVKVLLSSTIEQTGKKSNKTLTANCVINSYELIRTN